MDKKEVHRFIEDRRLGELRARLMSIDSPALKEIMGDLGAVDRVIVFRLLDKDLAIDLFENLDVDQQASLISSMEDPEVLGLIEPLDPDDHARLFEELPAKVTKRLLSNMSPQMRSSVNLLLGYPEGSAGRVMSPRYMAVRGYRTVSEVLSSLHKSSLRPDEMESIFVIDRERHYLGYIRLGQLIKATPDIAVIDLVQGRDIFARTLDPRSKAIDLIMEEDIPVIAVVDNEHRLVGGITFDDALDMVEEDTTADFHKSAFVTTVKTNLKDTSIRVLYRARLPWLLLLVFVNIFSGAGIALYESTIAEKLSLVFFLPLLIDSGGNAGTQSSTLVIRAMATGDVGAKDWLRMIGREAVLACTMGVTLALAVSLIGLERGGPEVALIVSLTMVIVILMGSLIGMSLPFLMARLNIDPATASAPLVTSIADISGVFIYFTMATWILGI
ncbi:MAG: magnesium transporter [Euryarchaeota archaeon]|nr:magnesium transporter [Euryarchaeota archaeon]